MTAFGGRTLSAGSRMIKGTRSTRASRVFKKENLWLKKRSMGEQKRCHAKCLNS